jgi:DNA-binding transcriptional LysR family regulator
VHIRDLDLNLLRLFDAVYRQRSVSRAAEALNLSQPAASQGLTRLRLLVKDPLFTRAARGVVPTAVAEALAQRVQQAMLLLEQGLNAAATFEPAAARRTFRIHMSDIGEAEFLPGLMRSMRGEAPEIRIETHQLDYADIEDALDSGKIDLAFGYLPGVEKTERQRLFMERYVVLARNGHPVLTARPTQAVLAQLDFVVVRHHTETAKVLERLSLGGRVRLSIPHFMVIPAIVGATDLAVVLPLRIACKFAAGGRCRIARPRWTIAEFPIALHWSRRAEDDPGVRWLRQTAVHLFREPQRAPKKRIEAPRVGPR